MDKQQEQQVKELAEKIEKALKYDFKLSWSTRTRIAEHLTKSGYIPFADVVKQERRRIKDLLKEYATLVLADNVVKITPENFEKIWRALQEQK